MFYSICCLFFITKFKYVFHGVVKSYLPVASLIGVKLIYFMIFENESFNKIRKIPICLLALCNTIEVNFVKSCIYTEFTDNTVWAPRHVFKLLLCKIASLAAEISTWVSKALLMKPKWAEAVLRSSLYCRFLSFCKSLPRK